MLAGSGYPADMPIVLWARWEGISLLLLLFLALPCKYIFQQPWLVRVLGPVHGVCFLLYLRALAEQTAAGNLTTRSAFVLMLAGCVPFGSFWSERRLRALELPGS